MTERIPLWGTRVQFNSGEKRGLRIKTRDCEDTLPPKHINEKHIEIQQQIDRRKVRHGEQHGWIEHDGEQVTDWHVDEDLIA